MVYSDEWRWLHSLRVRESYRALQNRRLIADRIEGLYKSANVGRATFLPEGIYQASVHLKKASNPGSGRVIICITDSLSNQFRFAGHSGGEATRELYETGGVLADSEK